MSIGLTAPPSAPVRQVPRRGPVPVVSAELLALVDAEVPTDIELLLAGTTASLPPVPPPPAESVLVPEPALLDADTIPIPRVTAPIAITTPTTLVGVPTFELPMRWVRWNVADPTATVTALPRGVDVKAGLGALEAVQGLAVAAGQVIEAAVWFPGRAAAAGGLTVRAFPSRWTARSARRMMMRTARRTPVVADAHVRRYAWGTATTPVGPGVFQDLVTESVDDGRRMTTLRCTVFTKAAPTVLVLEFFTIGRAAVGSLEQELLRTLDSLH